MVTQKWHYFETRHIDVVGFGYNSFSDIHQYITGVFRVYVCPRLQKYIHDLSYTNLTLVHEVLV